MTDHLPPDDTGREDAGRTAWENHKRQAMHDFERDTAHQPQQPGGRRDPIHVLRVALHDQPGVALYVLARWSLVSRFRRETEGSGDELADLGPHAMQVARAAQYDDYAMGQWVQVGTAAGDQWITWDLAGVPVEPVPPLIPYEGQPW